MDPIASRRTQAGAPVVHGIHAALWALDRLVANGVIRERITALEIGFRKFIYLETEVTLGLVRRGESSVRFELQSEGLTTTTLDISFTPTSAHAPALLNADEVRVMSAPAVLELTDLSERAGWLPICVDERMTRMFRHAATHLGANRVAAVARLSALVGMVCPGLYSIFSTLRVEVVPETSDTPGLSFTTHRIDERFRIVELGISGSGLAGTVTAFVRCPPVAQPSLSDLARSVKKDEFAATTALIIGGSRGLGAFTARAIAAGGGRVIITYLVGKTEAAEITREIGPHACRMLHYDAGDDPAPQLTAVDWEINQLYYFATPQIFRQKADLYVPGRFAEFCQIYVNGFAAACAALRVLAPADLAVFYPSSIFVEAPPRELIEYSMAKAAGEILCSELNRLLQGIRILVRRLPRVLTDQTATVLPVDSQPPLEVMLPIIREMHAN